jgi:hypothetical protein
MQLRLSIDTGQGPYEVTTTFFNVVQWERHTKRQASDLAKGIGYEDLARLAHYAAQSAGIVVPAVFDDFAKKIVSLNVVEEEPVNPTPSGVGPTD